MLNLKARWNQFANSRASTASYFTLTSSHYSLMRALLPVIERHARGRVLDLGAGHGTYRANLKRHCKSYVALDIQPKNGTLDLYADGRRLPFATNAFDTVFCSQVLEHTPEPWKLLGEAFRVLSPGGVLILSAPHLSYLHGIPHDYYRYTQYGLMYLLGAAGFDEADIKPSGSLLALIGSIPPTIYLALTPERPTVLAQAVLCVNQWLSRSIVAVDDLVDRNGLFALNLIAVAYKPKR